ncbi:hypothetical protein [Nocardiopsis protaetiae]|uniref:hypothetical protein n=1 Tax=Nocardiopsis protaetiae TaxID=3382270 RepID=UPI00387B04E0
MSDFVTVTLVGGPCDGGTLDVPVGEMFDPSPGFDFVPEDGSGAPPDLPRVLYTAAPGGPPDVWHWRGWTC